MTVVSRNDLIVFARDIKISHSIFAIPFVIAGLLIAKVSMPSPVQVFFILICMVSARSYAMGMNRFLDSHYDALNLRTRFRAIPGGIQTRRQCLVISISFGVIFVFSSFCLSIFAGLLSIPLLLFLAGYSLMKRVSIMTHWYLGLCLGIAPVAAQIALENKISSSVLYLGLAIAFWAAGFDLLYSLQDREFDIMHKLHSAPARLGVRKALYLSMFSFVLMIALIVMAGVAGEVGRYFYIGTAFVGCLLVFEHWLIRDAWSHGTSSNINAAFFNANALVSVLFLFFVIIDRWAFGG